MLGFAFQRWKRKIFSHPHLVRIIIGAILFFISGNLLYQYVIKPFWLSNYANAAKESISGFVDPASVLLQSNNRTNVLLMGIGGGDHEGPDLTDSMILVSINLKTYEVLLLPIPRDIWIASLRAKINTAFHYGEEKQTGGGIYLAKAAVSEVTDLPIHYAIVIDFAGFSKVVDLLGGIDVEVKRSFDDNKYPIPGMENAEPESDRYEHVHFDAGLQHMDGLTALKFVRSRNAEGEEGSDLARSDRQKQVMIAVKNKLISTNLIFNQTKLRELVSSAQKFIKTDITEKDYAAWIRLALYFQKERLTTASISVDLDENLVATGSGLLIHPDVSSQYDSQWVLVPRKGDFQTIHQYVQCLINSATRECYN